MSNNETRLRDAIVKCREKFQMYGDNHMAKTPPDKGKAMTNYTMVDLCNRALLPD